MDAEETRVYHALLIAGFIFFLVFVTFIVTIFNYQRRSVASYIKKMKADLRVVEKEKSRMAADLHDEIGSHLSAIKVLIDQLSAITDADKILVGKIYSVVRNMSLSVRQISNSMVPYALQNEGLLVSIDELIASTFPGSSTRVFTNYGIDESPLNEEILMNIYRIIQELLTNISKHAKATTIRISLQQIKTNILLHVNDDGVGFNEKIVKKSSQGVGLRNISTRVRILKGRIYLSTAPGKGTDYVIELSLQ